LDAIGGQIAIGSRSIRLSDGQRLIAGQQAGERLCASRTHSLSIFAKDDQDG
jgi:hypothetical protein